MVVPYSYTYSYTQIFLFSPPAEYSVYATADLCMQDPNPCKAPALSAYSVSTSR